MNSDQICKEAWAAGMPRAYIDGLREKISDDVEFEVRIRADMIIFSADPLRLTFCVDMDALDLRRR